MNKIIISYKNNIWKVDKVKESESNGSSIHLFFSVNPEEYKRLRLGYELLQNNNLISYKMFPQPGMTFNKNNQDYIAMCKLPMLDKNQYSMKFWMTSMNTSDEIITDLKEFIDNG